LSNKIHSSKSMSSTPYLQTVSNQVGAPLFIESFPKIPRAWHEMPWFGRSQSDKTNYLAS
jgi:hypothetical protein